MVMATITRNRPQMTVARALVESDGRVLVVRRAAWDTKPGMWELPGGKVDRGERVQRGLARELEEETGLMLAEARRVSCRELVSPRGRRIREHVYRVAAIGTVALSDEHDAYAWVESTDGLELTDSAEAAFSLVS
jgi:8-oxo-dGTP diphosphatase